MFVVALLAVTLSGHSGVSNAAAAPRPVAAHSTVMPATPSADGRITGADALTKFVARMTVPSFSRQTKLGCNSCHYGFPQLTPFGRLFKLNGYTMSGLPAITSQADSASRLQLSLPSIGPISVMALAASTSVATAVPGTQSTTTQFPQQLSLFAAGAISDKVGIFSQFTYTDQSGKFAIDNTDVRFASHTTIGDRSVLYGLTLHNNPTVQDVWNTTPAWGYPFNATGVAPKPSAATLIDGGLAQSVMGLGAYSLIDNTLYAEVTGYVSAPQGAVFPLDSLAHQTPHAISPYWRVGLQHQFASDYLMAGTFGLHSELFPAGVTGPTNQFTDIGADAQIEHKVGNTMLIGRATYIHEQQTLTAGFTASPQEAANIKNTLDSYKVNLSFIPSPTHTITVGYFGSSGTTDNIRYAPAAVSGSSTGNPGSQGETFELTANPWLNVRAGAQYVIYQKFNGASRNYDIPTAGRSAKDNNTLYVYLWFAY